MATDSMPEPRARRSPAPWFLALAILLLIVAAVATLLRSRGVPHNSPPSIDDPAQPIEALRAELSLDAKGRVIAELTPLYTDPAHQAFESQSLRQRLQLSEGEPWRLRLRWEAPAAAGGERGVVGSDLERGSLAVLGLGELEVFVGDQLVARSLEFERSADGPEDPVRTLLARPQGGVGPGEAVDVVLWGRDVNGRASLRGLTLGAEATTLELEPTTLARADLERSLTHEVRGDEVVRSGKKSVSGSSERGGRTRSATDG